MTVKLLVLVVFFSIILGVGFYFRRHVTNTNDFALGRRGVGPRLTALAYNTSYFSVVVFIGYAGQSGWRYGLASTWIGIGSALIGSLLAWVILGRRTRVMNKHLSSATIPEFFGSRSHSQGMKIAASLIIFAFLIPYTASVYSGLSQLFGVVLDTPCSVCVMGTAALTTIYITLGGHMATTINDFIQGITMLTGIAVVILSALSGQGGFGTTVGRLAQIPSEAPVTLGQPGAYTSFFGPDPLNLLGMVILVFPGIWDLPRVIRKFYIIRSEKATATGTVISTLFAVVISSGSYFLGGSGRLFDSPAIYNGNGSTAYDTIIPAMLSDLPNLLVGIVVMLMLSVSTPILSPLMLTSSSTLTLDFIKGCLVKNMKDKTQLVLTQCLIVMLIVLSVVLALDLPDFIAQLMGISWGVLAGALLTPSLYSLYWKRTTPATVWASFATGIGITVSNMLLHYIASPINTGIVSMIVGLIIVPLVSLLTPRMDGRNTNTIFPYYDNLVKATIKKVLSDDQFFDSPIFEKRKKK